MNIAVVGTGIIGTSHLKAIQQSNDFKLCAVCDINAESAAACAEHYGVPYFLDYKDIPKKTETEAVILNLPHWLHCEATVFFLEQGIHVLVEKPMANTREECNRMIKASVKNGKKLAVGHVQRYFQANRYVKEIVRNKSLGELCMITEFRTIDYFSQNRPKWFLDKQRAGGGIVMNYGAHVLDKVFYITDSRPIRVDAYSGNVANKVPIEGHSQIFIMLENKVTVSVTFCGYLNSGYETVYYFTGGTVKVVNGNKLYFKKEGYWEELVFAEPDNQLLRQLNEFYKLIMGDETEIPPCVYCADIISTIEDIYKQG